MNNSNVIFETEIDLKKLVIFIFRKWKFLLLAVVLGAVLLGGFEVVIGFQPGTDPALVSANQNQISQIQGTQDTYQKERNTNAETISNNTAIIAANEKRVENAELLLEDLETSLQAYRETQEGLQALLDQTDSTEEGASLLEQYTTLIDEIDGVVEEMDTVRSDITDYEAENESLNRANQTLEARNVELEQLMADNQTKIDTLTVAMETKTVSVEMGDVVRFAVVGALLGFFVACTIAAAQYVFSGKLKNAEELVSRYGYFVLGDIHKPNPKYGDAINRWLDRLDGVDRTDNVNETCRLISAKLQLVVQETPVRIMVTGTISTENLEWVGQQLQAILPATEYLWYESANLLENPQTIVRLKDTAVVLVEEKGISRIREMDRQARLLNNSCASVLGVIVL